MKLLNGTINLLDGEICSVEKSARRRNLLDKVYLMEKSARGNLHGISLTKFAQYNRLDGIGLMESPEV